MKRIILFMSVMLLMFINSFAGNKEKNMWAVVAGFTAPVTTGCAPLMVTFTSTSTSDGGDPIVSYTWNFGDGTTITGTDPNPSHTYLTTGNFSVTLTVTTQSSATDTHTENNYITTDSKITPTLGPDTTICPVDLGVGYQVTLGSGGYSFTWNDGYTNETRYLTTSGSYWAEIYNGVCTSRDTINFVVPAGITPDFSYTVLNDCGSMQIQLNDLTSNCGGGTVNYAWYTDDGGAYFTQNPTHTFTTEGTYAIYLYVDDGAGNYYDIVKTIDVTFSSGPTAPNLGANPTVCAGSSVQLDAGNETGATYSWSPATGLNDANIYNPIATPATTTTYTVTKTKCGIDAVSSVTITVNSLTVDLGPDQQTCGGVVTFNINMTGTSSVVWGGTDPSFGVGRTDLPTASTPVAGTYWVSVIKDGCEAKDTAVVTSKPAVDAAFSATQTTTCGIFNVQFTDMSVINCGSLKSYSWDFGDGTTAVHTPPNSSQKNPLHTYASTGSYTAILIVTTNSNKADTFTQVINVTGSGPSVNLGADRTICSGNSTTLDAGNAGATYEWSTGANTQTINVTTAGTYFVKVTNGACSASDTITVNVSATPPVVNLGPDRNICTGTSTTLDAGNAGATYLWSTGATTQTISVNSSGTYSVTVSNGSCNSAGSINITVSGVPPSVNLGADRTICLGSSVTLDAGNAGSTYEWSTGATTQTINVSTSGNYAVTVRNGACSATDDVNVTVNTSAVSVNLGQDTTLCSGGSLALDAGNAGAAYLWSTGATSQTITASASDQYWVEVTNGTCIGRDTINVTINTTPLVVDMGRDTAIACGLYKLKTGITGASSIVWGSNPFIAELSAYTDQPNASVMIPATYWVTVVKDGCTARDTVIVGTKKQVTAGFEFAQTGPACYPYAVKFKSDGHITIACAARKNFTWDFGDGTVVTYETPGSAQRNPTHDYAVGGTYTVTLIVTNTNDVADTVTHTVTVSGSGLDVNLGNDTTICTGSSIILDAGAHPGATYSWSTGATSQTITVSGAGNYSVTVSNGVCTDVDNITVTVAPDLNVDLGNDTTVCAGGALTLDAGHPGATYLWSTGETTQTIQPALTAGNTTYTVAVTQGSCSGNGEIDVNVVSSIPVSLGNDTAICTGSSLALNAGYPGATYAWSTGATSQTINVTTAGTYSVTVNHNGCSGSDELVLSLTDVPTSVNLGNDTTICSSAALVLDAGNPGATYLWNTGATTQTINVATSGTYSVTVSGCSQNVYDEIVVAMGTAPTPTITLQGNELVCSNADTYQWYKGGVLIPGATSKNYKPRGYGYYSVRVTVGSNGCVGEATFFFVPVGDIYLGDIRVKATPNPGNGLAKLILSKLPSKPIKVSVYDRVGRLVMVSIIVNTVNDLNLTKFAKGEYFVELTTDNKKVIIPLITQ
ncbi:MAG: PKD domain-containing protein [Agriterribacter sp.]